MDRHLCWRCWRRVPVTLKQAVQTADAARRRAWRALQEAEPAVAAQLAETYATAKAAYEAELAKAELAVRERVEEDARA